MNVKIAKHFTFDAAHRLAGLPAAHKCHRLHGHTYEVEFVLRGPVDVSGFVLDYGDIQRMWAPVFDALDHRYLNDIPGLEVPSTENLIVWLFRWFYGRRGTQGDKSNAGLFWSLLYEIRVKESSTTWSEGSKVEFLAFHGDMA